MVTPSLIGGFILGGAIGFAFDTVVTRAATDGDELIRITSLRKELWIYSAIEAFLILFLSWIWFTGRSTDGVPGAVLTGFAIGAAVTLFVMIFKTVAQRQP